MLLGRNAGQTVDGDSSGWTKTDWNTADFRPVLQRRAGRYIRAEDMRGTLLRRATGSLFDSGRKYRLDGRRGRYYYLNTLMADQLCPNRLTDIMICRKGQVKGDICTPSAHTDQRIRRRTVN